MMNQKVWEEQTEETQQILLEAMKETTAWNNQNAIQMNEEQLELIKQNSPIEIYELTENQRQEWIKMLDPIYEELAPKIGYKLVEDMQKLRAKYENEYDERE